MTRIAAEAMIQRLTDDVDTLLMVGPERTKVVQIEADPVRAGVRMPTAVPLVADAGKGSRRSFPCSSRRPTMSWTTTGSERMSGGTT